MGQETFEGGCLCGAIRYRVQAPATWSNLCFCRDCRRATGTPAVAFARFHRDRFALLAGSPARFRSSASVTRAFCDTCGTSLFVEGAHLGADIVVAVATLDAPENFPVAMNVRTGQRIPWMHPLPGLAEWSGDGDKPRP